jgi:hypothetical protein
MPVPDLIAEFSERLAKLERRVAALEPKPATQVKVPNWAKAGGENAGVNYSGPPSVPQHADLKPQTYPRKMFDGVWRDRDGNAVPDPSASPAAAAYHRSDPKHSREIEMLDAQLDRAAPLTGSK